MTPMQRSLQKLRDEGYTVARVEFWNPFARKRQDLWGMDILAMSKLKCLYGILGVQTTTASNAAARFKKLIAIPEVRIWLEFGNHVVVHSWAKRGERGKRKVWTCVERWITLEDLA